jgi:hypothetical protein
MAIIVTATASVNVGTPVAVQGDAPEGDLSAVFEDDGATGYFYFLDYGAGGQPIQDALLVYEVASVSDKHLPSEVKVAWSVDGKNAILLINGNPHVAFDSSARRAYSRTCFPPPALGSAWSHAEWSDEAFGLFPDEP